MKENLKRNFKRLMFFFLCSDKSREFRHASICLSNVYISSKVRELLPQTSLRWYFIFLIQDSLKPPKCGARGGIKCH